MQDQQILSSLIEGEIVTTVDIEFDLFSHRASRSNSLKVVVVLLVVLLVVVTNSKICYNSYNKES